MASPGGQGFAPGIRIARRPPNMSWELSLSPQGYPRPVSRSEPAAFLPLPAPEPARLIGVELEFMGPSARRAAQALAAGIGGAVVAEDAHAFAVRGSELGDLAVELDLRYAHPQRHGKTLPVRIGPRTAAGLGWLVSGAVPRELIV
uniref:amidoligase family protein n=1 Tax=Inquilinus sp. TaxID=1932117 RepID=UPI0037850715